MFRLWHQSKGMVAAVWVGCFSAGAADPTPAVGGKVFSLGKAVTLWPKADHRNLKAAEKPAEPAVEPTVEELASAVATVTPYVRENGTWVGMATATGVFVATEAGDFLLTCAHPFRECLMKGATIVVVEDLSGGAPRYAHRCRGIDEKADLCWFEIDDPSGIHLALADAGNLRVGAAVCSISPGKDEFPFFYQLGVVSALAADPERARTMSITMQNTVGWSGSPVILEDGTLAGLFKEVRPQFRRREGPDAKWFAEAVLNVATVIADDKTR